MIVGTGSILASFPSLALASSPDDDPSPSPTAPPPVEIRTGDDSYLTNTTYSATLSLEGAVAAGVLDAAQAAVVQAAAQAASREPSGGDTDSNTDSSNDDGGSPTAPTATVNSGECTPRATSRAADDLAWGGNDPAAGSLVVDICNGPESFYYVPTPAAAAAPAPPPPDPAVLAQQAYGELPLPKPEVRRSPSEGNSDPARGGLPFTIVGLHTWFWVPDWQPVQRTVELAGVSVTLTATPTALTFDPGNGDAPTSCAGPGRPWTPADGNAAPTNAGCAYVYRRVSADGPVKATTSVQWSVSWTSNTGAGGSFPTGVSEVTQSFLVEQIQVVVR